MVETWLTWLIQTWKLPAYTNPSGISNTFTCLPCRYHDRSPLSPFDPCHAGPPFTYLFLFYVTKQLLHLFDLFWTDYNLLRYLWLFRSVCVSVSYVRGQNDACANRQKVYYSEMIYISIYKYFFFGLGYVAASVVRPRWPQTTSSCSTGIIRGYHWQMHFCGFWRLQCQHSMWIKIKRRHIPLR